MKALLTGARGFIATHMYRRLVADGWFVHPIDIKEGDDICAFNFQERYDVIFHMAARASIPASFTNPAHSLLNNVYGSVRILEHARLHNIPVVFSSSSSVYGEPTAIPTPEFAHLAYVSPYALMKYEIEEYIKVLGVRGVALRYFNVFGEGQEKANEGDNSLLLAIFLQQHKANLPLPIVGTGEQRRDFVYVGDVVEANLAAYRWLATGKGTFGVFNVGTGVNYSVNEIADIISPKGKRIKLPARKEPLVGLADISELQKLGWTPKVNVTDWLKTQL